MNIRITRSLALAFAVAVTVFAGSVSHGAAQVACDDYGCYYPDGSPAYPIDPVYGTECDPYLGCYYPDPGYGAGCDPVIGCVNIVSPPVYDPGCDPNLGCYYPDPGYDVGCDPVLGCY